jgi:small subunit ribosomal protein S1
LASFGVFAKLEEGLEGLIHASEILLPPSKSIQDQFSPGQVVKVRILQVEPERQRLGLSMKLD